MQAAQQGPAGSLPGEAVGLLSGAPEAAAAEQPDGQL